MLQLNELKLVSASNIIRLRTEAGLTQAELGAKLNYSDKTISKWERGEAIPDAFVLTELAEMFGVTVDYLLTSHDALEAPQEEEPEKKTEPESTEITYSVEVMMALIFLSIWTAALLAFVVLWLAAGIIWPRIFAIALPVSLLVLLILMSVFKKTKSLQYVIAAFVFSIFVMLYFLIPDYKPWQLFLISVPAVAIVFLACNMQKKPQKTKKSEESET
jgi:transcriptional regulator with XRE-family HTH domain